MGKTTWLYHVTINGRLIVVEASCPQRAMQDALTYYEDCEGGQFGKDFELHLSRRPDTALKTA